MHDAVGRTQVARDRLSRSTLRRLAATLDRPAEVATPLFHWFHFLPEAAQATLSADGHPVTGGFLPDTGLPRRMWAGSRVTFHGGVPSPEVALERTTTIAEVREKVGASGRLVFVTLRHDVTADGAPALTEEQDIVYREAATGPAALAAGSADGREPAATRTILPDAALLFRFSALTFNAHRIHYDRDYARDVEGYPGLVVHGPLLATLLLDHALACRPGRTPVRFVFAARRPLFDGAPFDCCADANATALWTRGPDGAATMTASVEWR